MCENCKNAKLCKYKEQVEKFLDVYEETKSTGPECLEWDLKCKYFEEDMPEVKEKIPDCIDKYDFGKWLKDWKDYEPHITKLSSSSSPCADCTWYKNYIATGKVYIGDSPCQWCSNSPFKVTCTASVETRPEDVQTVTTKTVSRSREPGGMDYNSHTDEEV